MSNSPYATAEKISPSRNNRNHIIDTITPHCWVGQWDVASMLNYLADPAVRVSANYVIDRDGNIGLSVPENCRSWCTGNAENDHRAITIECASDTYSPYAITDKCYNALIKLCADIAIRNNISALRWSADKTLIGDVARQNITVHRWYANKECPGEYIYSRLSDIATAANKIIKSQPGTTNTLYTVQVGAFSVKSNAERLAAELKGKGYDTLIKTIST